ncbi:MAG: hypothetical protein ACI9BW_001248 [Gammaproteobacteria bacterium]|jgi:hypothetical protein
MKLFRSSIAALALVLGGCASYPIGPSVTALPGTGSTFDKFRIDDLNCQEYAHQAAGGNTGQAAQKSALDSAVVGTIVGAAAGALIGAASGNAGAGAAIGGGSGLLLGSVAGSDAYGISGSRSQERYDASYVQCMYGNGHQVPVPANVAAALSASAGPQAQPRSNIAYGYPPSDTPAPTGY